MTTRLSGDDALMLRRLSELYEISREKYIPRFTSFLNERQLFLARAHVERAGMEDVVFFGGYDGAVRGVCGFFPPYQPPEHSAFPITPVTIRFHESDALSHRDFLGALIGLGIKRESIGDILITPPHCFAFLLEPVARMALQELKKVGNAGVSCAEGCSLSLLPQPKFDRVEGTVSSVRLDSLIKLLTGLAREKAAGLIRSELVQRNYIPVLAVTDSFAPGDVITIRGYGKYTVDKIGSPTRKGRLPIHCRKYR